MPWGDPSILRQIVRVSRNIRDPHKRNVFLRAAVQTGLVESGGRNLPRGDQDSLGWRQERTSIYGASATNVPASVRRFRREFQRFYRPGLPSYEIAARVQRPAAQYRGRYQQVASEAARLLAEAGRGGGGTSGGGGGGGGGGTGPLATVTGGASPDRTIGQGSEGLVALLQSMQKQASQPPSGTLEAPSFSAGPTTPAGYKGVQTSGGPASAKPDVDAMIAAIQGTGQTIQHPGSEGVSATIGGTPNAPSTPSGGGGGARVRGGIDLTPRGGYQGTNGILSDFSAMGQGLGLDVSSSKRNNTNPYSGSRSDHDFGNKDATARDMSNGTAPTPEMDTYAKRVADVLGIPYKKGTPINKRTVINGIRYQLIYRGAGPAFGGNHMNHVHLGAKRVGRGGSDRGVL